MAFTGNLSAIIFFISAVIGILTAIPTLGDIFTSEPDDRDIEAIIETTSPRPFSAQSNVTFSGASSVPKTVDGTIVSYDWGFGDGDKASGSKVTHAFSEGGKEYQVTLTIYDDKEYFASEQEWFPVEELEEADVQGLNPNLAFSLIDDTKIINRNYQNDFLFAPAYGVVLAPLFEPKAAIKVAGKLETEYPLRFSAENSFVHDGIIENYQWNFGDGTLKTLTESQIEHTYENPGDYQISLIVTDDEGAIGVTLLDMKIKQSTGDGVIYSSPPDSSPLLPIVAIVIAVASGIAWKKSRQKNT